MKSRILVSVVGITLLLYVVLAASPIILVAALTVLNTIAAYELQYCVTGGAKRGGRLGLVMAQAGLWPMLLYFFAPRYIPLYCVLETLLIFFTAILDTEILEEKTVNAAQIMAGICTVVVIPYAFSAFIRMVQSGYHRAFLLLPFILSFACDTFAYFTGMAIGKHKLAPLVSPKKTVEGSIGGLLGNVVCGEIFVLVMDRWFGGCGIGYGIMLLLALLCGVVAQLGDLSFSYLKREFGIKDYGHLFLEHGGVLDRFDSVLFVTPVLEIILSFVK